MQPADPQTLPHRSDRSPGAAECAWRDELAPAAQPSLFASERSQRGLDGRWYELTEATPPEGGETEPSLGPQHGLLHGPLAPAPADPFGPVQLRLDLADVDAYPQLGLWGQLDTASALHARAVGEVGPENALPGARGFESRACKCHRTRRIKGDVRGKRSERGAWTWSGLVSCDLWTCPLCGRRRARETSSTLGVAIERHLAERVSLVTGAAHDAWMLTPTIPHVAGDLVGVTIERLFRAWSHFTRSSEWKAFRRRWKLRPVVRVLDATFGGASGAHPHFHVLLLPCNAMDWTFPVDDDGRLNLTSPTPTAIPLLPTEKREARLRELALALWPVWDAACAAAGITRSRSEHAIELTGADQARAYFVEWGLGDEVGATTSKLRSHLRLLDAAAAGREDAAAAYTEWCAAVDGRQWVTGLADLAADMRITDDDVSLWVAELRAQRDQALRLAGTPVVLVPELDVVIPQYLYPTALKVGWAALHKLLDDAGERAQLALIDELLDRYRARYGRAPPDD